MDKPLKRDEWAGVKAILRDQKLNVALVAAFLILLPFTIVLPILLVLDAVLFAVAGFTLTRSARKK